MEIKLLPCEQQAKAFVQKYTVQRCQKVLAAIARRFDRRYELACNQAFIPLNREFILKTPLEVDLMHRLKIGISLLDDQFSPVTARLRNLKRIAVKGGKRGKRAQEKLDELMTSNL